MKGKGAFAKVLKVSRKIDGKLFAAKVYSKEAFLLNKDKEKLRVIK